MSEKQKIIKKVFSAPTKKTDSTEEKHEDKGKKEMLKKSTSFKPLEKREKKSNQLNHPVSKIGVEKKTKEADKTVPKSLTDEEYAEIFNSVLNQTLDEDSESLKNVQLTSPRLTASKEKSPIAPESTTKDCEDELDILGIDHPIDQWNDRPEEPSKYHTPSTQPMKVNKKEKEKTRITTKQSKEKKEISTATMPIKNEKKPKIKHKTVEENIASNKNKSSLISPNKDNAGKEVEEETGTWVQCSITDCSKWRYVPDISDPLNVPDHWECSMNSDKLRNTCDAPEVEYDESEHILTKFTLGSIVWAKMDGFPWWPAMIDTDPDYDTYFELTTATSMMPHMYHVTFLDEHVSRAWVRSHLLTPYDHRSAPMNKMTAKSQSYKKDLHIAISNADRALKLNLQDRLDKYSFLNRFPKSTLKRIKVVGSKKKSKKVKRNIGKNILSSPDAMLKEIEMAIATCDGSDGTDFSEDDAEYLPQKSRRLDPGRDEKNALHLNNEQKGKEKNQQLPTSDSDSEIDCSTEENEKGKAQSGVTFDPNIFTMELMPPKGMQKNTEGESHCSDGEGASGINETNISDQKMSGTTGCITENKDLLKNEKRKNDDDDNGQSLSLSTNKKKKLNPHKKTSKKKALEKLDPSTNVQHNDPNFDSEKENKDPNDSSNQDKSVKSPSKQKNDLNCEKTPVIKKQKKEKAKKSDQEYSKEIFSKIESKRKDGKEQKALFHGLKKAEEKQFVYNNKKLHKSKQDTTASLICSDTYIKETVSDEQGKIDTISHDNKKEVNNANIDNLCNGNEVGQNELKDKDNETESGVLVQNAVIAKNKSKGKSKGFLNPATKDKPVCKSNDRNVPCCPSVSPNNDEHKHYKKNNKESDQSVPDVANEVIEEELDFTCHNIEKAKSNVKNSRNKKIKLKKEENFDDEEDELNLSVDSLDPESVDIIDLEEDDDDETATEENGKYQYGKFAGHCSEHGSDSDPFELIEE